MKLKIYQLTLAAVTAAALTGCETPYGTPDNTGTGMLAGGAIGAGSGALIGSASGHAGEGALIGAAIGTITGGLVGHSVDQQQEAALRAQSPQTYARVEQGQPLSVADVKALVAAKISDDTVIAQIQSSHTVYHLSTADIIDLHQAGVSDRVIGVMLNSSPGTIVQQAPPPPPVETVIIAPEPDMIWVAGEWTWVGNRWIWAGGHWVHPPHERAVWVEGGWYHGGRGWEHRPGYWR